MEPITRQEQLLNSIATGNSVELEPITREEQYLSAIAGSTDLIPEKPITRKEMFYKKILEGGGAGGGKEEQEKTVEITANGTVEVVPDEGKTLSKVTANVNVASTGEVGKPYIDTSKMTYFEYFCYKNRLNEQVDKLDTSNGIEFGSCFRGCSKLKKITKLDVSKGKYFSECFYECYALESLPPLDISNGQTFYNMFSQCRKLDNVVLTAPKDSLSTNTFSSCTALKNITIGEGWAVNIYLHYSNELTVESLHGMIENLADLTGQTAKIFQVGATNIAKIDEAHIQMLNDKNWTYS